jgi:hypothetical protein
MADMASWLKPAAIPPSTVGTPATEAIWTLDKTDILEDTLLGFRVQPWKKSKTRRMILTEKFYLFDIGVANYLMNRRPRLDSPNSGNLSSISFSWNYAPTKPTSSRR